MLSLLLDVASPLSIIFGSRTSIYVFCAIALVCIAFLVAMIVVVKKMRKKVAENLTALSIEKNKNVENEEEKNKE